MFWVVVIVNVREERDMKKRRAWRAGERLERGAGERKENPTRKKLAVD